LTFFQRGRWRVDFRHAQGYAKNPWRLYVQRHTDIQCLPLHANHGAWQAPESVQSFKACPRGSAEPRHLAGIE
jgi:hypothetical protein